MDFKLEALSEQYLPLVISYSVQFVSAIAIFFIGKWFASAIANVLQVQMGKRKIDPIVSGFMRSIIYWVMLAFITIAALAQLGIQTAQFIAILGAAGLAIGLSLQGSLSNFASGVLIIIFKPFKLGDYVEAGGQTGVVTEIKIFSIQLLTTDNKEILIPNSSVMNGSITNYTSKETRRVDLKIGVSYDAYLPDVRKLLEDIINNEELVLKNAENQVAVSELGESSVNLVVRAWVKTEDYWTVYFKLTETIKLKLDEANIVIPYPQMNVYLSNKDA